MEHIIKNNERIDKSRSNSKNQFSSKNTTFSFIKINIAIALLILFSVVVHAGDVIIDNGKLDVNSKLYVDGSGKVGIGTTNPSEKLDVIGKVKGTELCIGNDCRTAWPSGGSGLPAGTLGQTLRHDGTNWVSSSLLSNSGSDNIKIERNNEVYLNIRNSEASGRQWALVSAGSSGGIGVGKFSIYDKTADISRLTIDSSGKVGIGTTGPNVKLEVVGADTLPSTSGSAAGNSIVRFKVTGDPTVLDIGGTSAGKTWLQSRRSDDYGSNFALLLNPNGGNVGIGTTGPSYKLHVNSPGADGIHITNNAIGSASGDGSLVYVDASGNFRLQNQESASTSLWAGNTQHLTVTSAGSVGIGTINPTVKLDVNGPIKATGTGGNVLHDCVRRSNSKPIGPSDREVSVSCAAGEIVTGGGCTHGSNYGLRVSIPEGSTVWHCVYTEYSTDIIIAYAICCQI